MNPFMQESIMCSTGMPTLGRRAKGFGASPFGPGGAVPVHHMNLGGQGMCKGGFGGAGSYPYPHAAFPLGWTARPLVPVHAPMAFDMASGGDMDGVVCPPCPPRLMVGGSMMYGGGLPGIMAPCVMGGAALGGGGLLDGLDDWDDDTAAWDGDEDGERLAPFDLFYPSTNRRARRRGKGRGMFGMPGMMANMGIHGMGMGMAMPMRAPVGCM